MEKELILIDVPMPIMTPRLRLEPVQAGFGAAVHSAVEESLETLRPWSLWVHKPEDMTLAAREKWLRESEAKFIQRDTLYMMAFERETDIYIGNTGFHDIDWDIPGLEIGYWVRKSRHGRGYATEMTVGLLHYAFNQLGARRVQISHALGNEPSRRVIEKAGFKYEGILRNSIVLPGNRVVDRPTYSHIDIKDVPPLDVTW